MNETPEAQIKRQIEDPDETHVGPYEKNGDNAFAIESLAWAVGLRINAEGYTEPLEAPKARFINELGDDLGEVTGTELIGSYEGGTSEYRVWVRNG